MFSKVRNGNIVLCWIAVIGYGGGNWVTVWVGEAGDLKIGLASSRIRGRYSTEQNIVLCWIAELVEVVRMWVGSLPAEAGGFKTGILSP
jgi:hypothetical protein